jgi:hypothetical protein
MLTTMLLEGLTDEIRRDVEKLVEEMMALDNNSAATGPLIADKFAAILEKLGRPVDAAEVRDARFDSDRVMAIVKQIGKDHAIED